MNSKIKKWIVTYSIIKQKDGTIVFENQTQVVEAPREMTAMALLRIELANNGFDDKYMVLYHDVEPYRNIDNRQ